MYEIINRINDTVFIGRENGIFYTLKKIHPEDNEIYKKLMTVENENISKIIGFTVIENDFFAVTEFVNGITVREKYEKDGAFSDEDTKRIITAVCSGLEAIHGIGLVHRDITPNNIMLTENGKVKIIDFGISRFYKENSPADTQILGTQGFAAPEQYGFGQSSGKTDIYAVGVLINYMKTGVLPNEKTADGILGRVVEKCTRMDENKRYNNISDVSLAVNEKNNARKLVRWIPGFRNGILFRELIAVFYLVGTAVFAADFCFFVPEGSEKSPGLSLLIFGAAWFPFFIIGNAADWQKKIKFVASKAPVYRVLISILLTVLVLAVLFFIAVLL